MRRHALLSRVTPVRQPRLTTHAFRGHRVHSAFSSTFNRWVEICRRLILTDLEKYFAQTVSPHGRRIFRRGKGLEIETPDEWKARSYALRDKYEGLVFDRSLRRRLCVIRGLMRSRPCDALKSTSA